MKSRHFAEPMSHKIIFIINSAHNQRCIKRVEEFMHHGYDIEAYAISRNEALRNDRIPFELKIVATYDNLTPYHKRLGIIWKALKGIKNKHNGEDVVYYFFGLDIAMLGRLVMRSKYFYEESDLVHSYLGKRLLVNIFESIDKHIITHSKATVFTSEGFLKYHYGDQRPNNTFLIPNRLNPSILQLEEPNNHKVQTNKIRFGFVGGARYESIAKIAEYVASFSDDIEFHFYGSVQKEEEHLFTHLKDTPNIIWHGAFKNPKDLPEIYSALDVVVSTYDVKYDNVRYAEPNKIYEAIYFRTPIIVSSGTFLAEKVARLGIGYDVNPLDKDAVFSLIKRIQAEGIDYIINNIKKIDKMEAINSNDSFFQRLEEIL